VCERERDGGKEKGERGYEYTFLPLALCVNRESEGDNPLS